VQRLAVIKKCREQDLDDRPKSKQKWCLYTHDGKRLLGRHPSEEAAQKQERAIQVNKHGSTPPQTVKYKGATYVLREPPKEIQYKGAKYVLAGQQAVMWSPEQGAAVNFEILVRQFDDLNAMIADATTSKDDSGNDYVVMWSTPLMQKLKDIDKALEVLHRIHKHNLPK